MALRDDRHVGRTLELTGPRLLTFREAVDEIALATGRTIRSTQIPVARFRDELVATGLPEDYREVIVALFTEILDGRNAHVTDGVAAVLGRPPRDFADYVRAAAASGAWTST